MDTTDTKRILPPEQGPTKLYGELADLAVNTDPVEDEEDDSDVDTDLVQELTTTSERGRFEDQPTPAATGTPTFPAVATPTPAITAVWGSLALQLLSEAAVTTSSRRAAVLLYELGRIYEVTLNQPDRALETYKESHERFPGLAVNARALVRLLLKQGNYAACLPILEAELAAVSSVEERAAILTEKAMLELEYLSDPEAAKLDLLRAQKMVPDDPLIATALAKIYRQLGEFKPLEEILQSRSRVCRDPELSSALVCEAAHIHEEHFKDMAGASTLYRTALNIAPSNLHALHALLRTARANRDFPAVAKLCEALAEIETGPAAAAALWSAARIYRDKLRNAELAVAALEKAASRAPDDRALLSDLVDLYSRTKAWKHLAITLQKTITLTSDPKEKSVLSWRLAQVKLERLQDTEGAVESLREALSLAPAHVPIRRMLGRLYARQEQYLAQISLLTEEIDFYSDPERKAAIAFRIGKICETKLDDLPRAAEAYEKALSFFPRFRPAAASVSRALSSLLRFEDQIAIYERELAVTTDREEKLLLMLRISEIWEHKLNEPAAALNSYERIIALDPTNISALQALHRLYAMGNRWSDLVTVLKIDADQTMDRWRRISLLTEAAEIQERHLNENDSALQTYQEVLDIAPTYQPALMACGRILQQQERYQDLVKLHRREIESTEEPAQRIWLLMKIGRIEWEKLQNNEEAINAYAEVLTTTPRNTAVKNYLFEAHFAAADMLIRIFRQKGTQVRLLEFIQQIPCPEKGTAQALYHLRIAEALQHSQRPALAVEHLRRAFDATGDDAALFQLTRIYNSIGDRQSLIGLYQSEAQSLTDARGLLSVYFKLARFWSEEDYDLERAVEALERILEIDPRNHVALKQLEPLLTRLERWEHLAAVLELSRESSDDIDHRIACALTVAAIKIDRLNDLHGAAHSSFEVLERYPTHPEALSTLEEHYRKISNVKGLIQILGRSLKGAQSSAEQAAILTSIASAYAAQGETHEAFKTFHIAVETLPTYLPAIRGWFRAAHAIKDPPSMAQALELEADASHDRNRKVHCFFEAGQIWERDCGDQDNAIATYRRVLDVDPIEQRALDALSAIFTARKDWRSLVSLLQKLVEKLTDQKQIRDTLARIADLERARLGEIGKARETIYRALEYDPNDYPLLTTLAELCRSEKDYNALASVNMRLLRLTTDPLLLKALHFELGMIWEEKLPDPLRAIEEYQRVLELDPNDLGALTRLSELLFKQQNWPAAAYITERLLGRDDDRNRVKEYHLRLAQIYKEGFRDPAKAVESCRRALALDPGDIKSAETMTQLLSSTADDRALEAHFASTLAVHRARLDRDPFRVSSYHALTRVFQWQNADDPLAVIQKLLELIGAPSAQDHRHKETPLTYEIREPERPISAEEIEQLILFPDERGPLFRLMTLAEPVLRKILQVGEPFNKKGEKITARSYPDLNALINRLKKAVGGVQLVSYLVDNTAKIEIKNGSPPVLTIGERALEKFKQRQLVYMLAQHISAVRLSHPIYSKLKPAILGRAIAAVISVVCHSFIPPYPISELEEIQLKLNRALGKRVRLDLEKPCLALSDKTIDPTRWQLAMKQSEDRLAVAIYGDLSSAFRCILREENAQKEIKSRTPDALGRRAGPRTRQLLSFIISEEYFSLRERTGQIITI